MVVMFPEGTRRRKGCGSGTRHAGERRSPCRSWGRRPTGSGRHLRHREARPARPLRVAYGPAIDTDDLSALPDGEAARIATDRCETHCWSSNGVSREAATS